MMGRRSESGNIFFMLFGAVALVGVVAAATSTLMRGPLSTVVNVNARAKADTQMQIAAKLAMVRASQQVGPGSPPAWTSGDCDSDGNVEPIPAKDASPKPLGGGQLPPSIGASAQDPWGNPYGYCVWDIGTKNADAACGVAGGEVARLKGDYNTAYPVMVIVSSGPDRQFQTECNDWITTSPGNDPLANNYPTNTVGTLTGQHNTAVSGDVIYKPTGSDDIIISFSYDQASQVAGGLWSLTKTDPNKITTNKELDIQKDATFASATKTTFQGAAQFDPGSRLDLGAGGMFNLPNDTAMPDSSCIGPSNSSNNGALRLKVTGNHNALQVCDFNGGGWTDPSASGLSVSKIDDLTDAVASFSSQSKNIMLGDGTGLNFSSTSAGVNNVMLGIGSAASLGAGSANLDNVIIGSNTATSLTGGAHNILIGSDINVPTASTSGFLSIGNTIFATGMNGTGTTVSAANVGIGTAAPNTRLDVAGTIQGTQFQFNSSNALSYSSGNITLSYGGASQLFVNGNGLGVGISPTHKLDVDGDAYGQRFISTFSSASTYPGFTFGGDVDTGISHPAAGVIGFTVGGSEKARLSSTGLGIGTTSPGSALDVVGEGAFTSYVTSPMGFRFDSSGSSGGVFNASGNVNIKVGGGATSATFTSSGLGVGLSNPQVSLDASGAIRPGMMATCNALLAGAIRFSSDTLEYCSTDGNWYSLFTAGGGGGGSNLWTNNTSYISRVNAHFINASTALPAALSSAGDRFFWYPNKSTLRAGGTTGSEWSDANIGNYSFAVGLNTKASGDYSFAGGQTIDASGANSVGLGQNLTASGTNAVALGYLGVASGNNSVMLGRSADATGTNSMAFGLGTPAGVRPIVSGNRSLGIFMGDQSGKNITSDNTMELLGGKFLIDANPSFASSTTIGGSLTMDVNGYMGADQYCDSDGAYCFTAQSITSGSAFVFENSSNVIRFTSGTVNYSSASFVAGSPQLADDGIAGHRNRFFFDKSSGSFRAGGTSGTAWDTVGGYSMGLGYDTVATGNYSAAFGRKVQATGANSVAYGLGAAAGTAPNVSGTSSYGIFMGDQSGVNFSSGNTFGLFGGRMVIDPRTPATQLIARGVLDLGAATDAMVMPTGTTAQKPTGTNAINGMIRYNTDNGKFEAYQQGAWQDIITSATAGAAATPDRGIQFNSGNNFAASANLTYTSTGILTSTNRISVGGSGADAGSVFVTGGNSTSTGANNTAVGNSALPINSSGISNVAIGQGSMLLNSTGQGHTAVGAFTLASMTGGIGSTAIGQSSLNQSTGSYNTGLGYQAANALTTGSYNIAIGQNAQLPLATGNYQLNIGNFITGDMANGLAYISGTGALKLPVGTTLQTPSGVTAVNGMIRYDSDKNKFQGYQAGTWQDILTSGVSGGAAAPNRGIQFNSGNNFAASSAFTYTDTAAAELDIDGSSLNKGAYLKLIGKESPKTTGNDAGVILMTSGNTATWNMVLLSNTPGYNGDLQFQHYDGSSWTTPIIFNSASKVGINQDVARTALDVNGSIRLADGGESCSTLVKGAMRYTSANTLQYCNGTAWTSTAAGTGVMAIDDLTDAVTLYSSSSMFIGSNVGSTLTTGQANTALGANSMLSITTGSYNVAYGNDAMRYIGTTTQNTAVGAYALRGSSTVASNTGVNNTAIGFNALLNNTSGQNNNALGVAVLKANTTGSWNNGMGVDVLKNNTTGYDNNMIGDTAFTINTTGYQNSGIGGNVLEQNTSGFNNTALGFHALAANTSGSFNIGLGYYAGVGITTGTSNIIIGGNSGSTLTTGSGNLLFGSAINTPAAATNNYMSIGNLLFASGGFGAGTTVGAGFIGVRTASPRVTFDIVGTDAMMIPAGTTAQQPAANVANGMVRYNTTISRFEGYQNGSWLPFSSGGGSGVVSAIDDLADAITKYSSSNMYLGQNVGATTTGTAIANTALGTGVMSGTVSGNSNSAFGAYSQASLTSGQSNNSFGFGALVANTSGNYNTAMGTSALYSNNTGSSNIGIGDASTYWNTTGSKNIAIGAYTLSTNVAMNESVAIGYGAMQYANNSVSNVETLNTAVGTYALQGSSTASANTGLDNTAIGHSAMNHNTSGSRNAALGDGSLWSNTTGSRNVAIGAGDGVASSVLFNNTTGSDNVGIGYNSLASGNGTANTAIGAGSLRILTTGNYNLAFGSGAGENITSGSSNIMIGTGVNAQSATASNQLSIGNLIFGSGGMGTNTTVGTGFIGIRTASPRVTFDITGTDAMMIPAGTTAQQPSAANVANGMVRYNTTISRFEGYQNGSWLPFASGGGSGVVSVIDDLTDAITLYSSGSMYLGSGVGGSAVGNNNTALGSNAYSTAVNSAQNTAFGTEAMRYANSTPVNTNTKNTAVGFRALRGSSTASANTGTFNTAIGTNTLQVNTTGDNNVAIGVDALGANNTGANNSAIGTEALAANTTGTQNTAIGLNALFSNTTGSLNTAIGIAAMESNVAKTENTAIGYNAMKYADNTAVVSSSYNLAIGNYALQGSATPGNNTGTNNTAIGYGALKVTTSGSSNLAIGVNALSSNTTGSNNIAFGRSAGFNITTGSNNLIFGSAVLTPSASTSDYMSIANLIFASGGMGTGTTVGTGLIGIRTASPRVTLDISGTDAMMIPAGTTAQQPAAASVANGMVRYNTTISRFEGYQNGSWLPFASGGGTGVVSVIDDLTDAITKYSSGNMYLGSSVGATATTGSNNTALGSNSMLTVSSGYSNNAFGAGTLQANTTGSGNSAFGTLAMNANITGVNNTAFGVNSLVTNQGKQESTAVGYSAMAYADSTTSTGVTYNTAVGAYALQGSTTAANNIGINNTAIGHSAAISMTSGSSNTAVGAATLSSNQANSGSTAVGYGSMFYANNTTTGITTYNTALGAFSLYGSTTASSNTGVRNTGVGYSALMNVTSGSGNVAVGALAGGNILTGSGNILFGSGADVPTTSTSNYLNIGNFVKADMGNGLAYISANGAIQLPNGTTAQQPSGVNALNGMVRYNTTLTRFEGYQNGSWLPFSSSTGSGTAAGSTTQIQFNSGNAFAANANLVYSSGAFMVSGTYSGVAYAPASGAGSRMFFDPASGAFRAGVPTGTAWNAASLGKYSFAGGSDTIASGDGSTAFGNNGTSSGVASFSAGDTNQAIGAYSVALGVGNVSGSVGSGRGAAIGDSNSVTNWYATAIGHGNTVDSNAGMAFGTGNQVHGAGATAIGYNNNASGDYSLALGAGSRTSASYAVSVSFASATGTIPQVTGAGSFGLFMGNQNAVSFASANTMGLFGGRFVIDPNTPATQLVARSVLDVGAATDAIVTPRGTTLQRPASTIATNGMMRYNTTTNNFEGYQNGSWLPFSSAAAGAISAAGSNTQIQFNSGGVLAATGTFAYSDATSAQMDIDGTTKSQAAYLKLTGAESPVTTGNDAGIIMTSNTTGHKWNLVFSNAVGSVNDFQYQHYDGSTWTNPLVLKDNGKIGVGNGSTITTALDVNGSLRVADGGETCDSTVKGAIRYTSTNVLQYCNSTAWTTPGSGGSAAGSTTQLQFNSGGVFGASANLTFSSANILAVTGAVSVTDRIKITPTGGLSAPSALALANLSDVSLGTLTTGYVLTWNGTNWAAAAASAGGGAIDDLSDAATNYTGSTTASSNSLYSMFLGQSVGGVAASGAASNTGMGFEAFKALTTGNDNVALGDGAARYLTTASENVAIGSGAMNGIVGTPLTGNNNTGVGASALTAIRGTANGNTALGAAAANATTTGVSNTALGSSALYSNKANNESTAIGFNAMYYANSTATGVTTYNTAVGAYALQGSTTASNNTGVNNTAMGHSSMLVNTSGKSNVAIGDGTLSGNSTGSRNTALGAGNGTNTSALFNNGTGNDNVAIGYGALSANVSGTANTAVGSGALIAVTGSNNIGFGSASGANITSGSSNIMIGTNISAQVATASNQMSIGNLIFASGGFGTGTTVGTGFIGIRTALPRVTLDITGTDAMMIPAGNNSTNRPAAAATANGMMRYNTTANNFEGYQNGAWLPFSSGGGSGTPAGSNLQVQINNGGAFAGYTGLTFSSSSNTLTVGSAVNITGTTGLTAPTAMALSNLSDVSVSSPSSGQVLSYNGTAWVNSAGGGGSGAAGSNMQVQFNSGGSALGASANFSWDNANGGLGIGASPLAGYMLYAKANGLQGVRFQNDTGIALYVDVASSDTSNPYIRFSQNNTSQYSMGPDGADSSALKIGTGDDFTNTLFKLDASGNLTIKNNISYSGVLTDTSDRRLKTDIHPLMDKGSMLDKVNKIGTYTYRLKKNGSYTQYGVMAQELKDIFPELVITDTKTPENYMSVNYTGLIAPLIESTKELKAQNDNLKSRVAELESQQKQTHADIESLSRDIKGMKAYTGYGIDRAGIDGWMMLLMGVIFGGGGMAFAYKSGFRVRRQK